MDHSHSGHHQWLTALRGMRREPLVSQRTRVFLVSAAVENPTTHALDLVDTFSPEATDYYETFSRTFAAVTGDRFRAEFIQTASADNGYVQGPRILELDAVAVPEPSPFIGLERPLPWPVFRNERSKPARVVRNGSDLLLFVGFCGWFVVLECCRRITCSQFVVIPGMSDGFCDSPSMNRSGDGNEALRLLFSLSWNAF